MAFGVGFALAVTAPGLKRASAQSASPAARTVEIHIDNFAFTPAVLTIQPGTTVTFTNRDDIPHTVVEKSIAWRSKALDTGDTYQHTFDTAGDYQFFCSLHPHMTGRIVVKP